MFGQQNCFTNTFQNIQNSLNTVSNRLSTLSSSLISSTNLPVYLQNYTFSSSSSVFSPYFTIVGGLPTNQSLHRTWNLVTAGSLSSGSKPTQPLIFTYDFSGVVSSYSVTIDGTLAGTLTIDGQVYDAATYFSTPTYNYKKNILTLTLDVSNISWNTNGGDFSYNLFVADAASGAPGGASGGVSCDQICNNNYNTCANICVNNYGFGDDNTNYESCLQSCESTKTSCTQSCQNSTQ